MKQITWFFAWSLGGLGGGLLMFLGLLVLLGLLTTAVLSPGSSRTTGFTSGVPAINPAVNLATLPLRVTHLWTGPENQAVVNDALYVAAGLSNGPPDGLDTWYSPARIPAAIAYWQQTCAGCSAWAQGNLQCVMLVSAAYGLAEQPLPYIGNAATFWTSGAYRHVRGWEMLPPTALPYPGDMIVLNSPFFDGVGHIVVVVDVKIPGPGGGYVQFAEANGPGSIDQMPLWEDAGGFTMAIWRDYTVLGYIRHTAALTLPVQGAA